MQFHRPVARWVSLCAVVAFWGWYPTGVVAQERREPEGGALPEYAKRLHLEDMRPPAVRLEGLRDGRPKIMLTGYWPPTNEMLRQFSPNLEQNPGGWVGENWEGRGYNIYAFFPEFPDGVGKGEGDFEVDYQDTSGDWWPLVELLEPVAIVTFSRGSFDSSWEVERIQRNLLTWIDDYQAPFQPTPAPPDDSVPVDNIRYSSLPMEAIVSAVDAEGLDISPFIDQTGAGGGFCSEFIAYHGTWYHGLYSLPLGTTWNVAAGHIHVGANLGIEDAVAATEITIRTVIDYVDDATMLVGDMNCDHRVDAADIAPFVQAIVTPETYPESFPYCDIGRGDLNGDGHLDGLDIQGLIAFFLDDCNGNGRPDEDDIFHGTSNDCNGTGVPDECDIADGVSQDCTANGIPDECEPDCNFNGAADSCDIDDGTSQDTDENGVPDECQDVSPPTDLAWAEEPHPISSTEIRMVGSAVEAENPPVEYAFLGFLGANDRSWDADPVFIDSGLGKNHYYQYYVAARDSSPQQNETSFELPIICGTEIEMPGEVTFGAVTETSIEVFTAHVEDAGGLFTNLTLYDSGLFFEVTTIDGTPVGGADANTWVQYTSQSISATGLTPDTTYRFRVKGRNLFGDETDWFPVDDPGPVFVEQATASPPMDMTVDILSDQPWMYENLAGSTSSRLTFNASVTDDPQRNGSYSYTWSIEPPPDLPGAEFVLVSGGDTSEVTYAAPKRPAYSPSGQAYVVRCTVTGDDHGNQGEMTLAVNVRVLADADGDGCTDASDHSFIQAVAEAAAPDSDSFYAADVNCDGVVNGVDRYIAVYVSEDTDGYGRGQCE